MTKQQAGQAGQQAAEEFLLQKGLNVLARNYRVRSGEVDLIVRDGVYVVFVEVKFRSGVDYGLPREAVGGAKQKKIIDTAMHFLHKHELAESDIRFDVVEVLEHGGQLYVSHIEDAFWA